MIGSAQDSDGPLVRSLAAVWKSYLDQESATREAVIRSGSTPSRPSAASEAHHQNLALGIAWLLNDVAGPSFARLYQSSLTEERAGAAHRYRRHRHDHDPALAGLDPRGAVTESAIP